MQDRKEIGTKRMREKKKMGKKKLGGNRNESERIK